MGMIIFLLF